VWFPADTDENSYRIQIDIYRRLGAEARARMAAEMSEDARRIALAGIRQRHPEYDGQQARRALFRLLLGDGVVRAMWPGEPPVAP
jgi:ABC-type uncharacterized transport system YnjBCD ATPase subunit